MAAFTGGGIADLAVLSARPLLGFDGGVGILRGLPGLRPVCAASRKVHGRAGTFDISLSLTGTPGIECRSGGTANDYTLMLTFSGNVSVTGNVQAEVISGSAIVGTSGSNNGRVE